MEETATEPAPKRHENLKAMVAMALLCYGPLLAFSITHMVLYRLGVVPALHGLTRSYTWWFIACAILSLQYFSFPKLRRVAVMLPLSLLVAVACLGIAFAVNFKAVRVEGDSMEPTLLPGDVLLMDLTEPADARFGIYVLDVPDEEHNPLIKRLVGFPGEAIDVRYGRVFANEEEVYPRDGSAPDSWNRERPAYARFYDGAVMLNDDEYFFLGDNPPDSRDSETDVVCRLRNNCSRDCRRNPRETAGWPL